MSQTTTRRLFVLVATSIATIFSIALTGAGVSISSAAGPQSDGSTAYRWPPKPFDRTHPVRAMLGDPRTVFRTGLGGNPLAGSGQT